MTEAEFSLYYNLQETLCECLLEPSLFSHTCRTPSSLLDTGLKDAAATLSWLKGG